MSPVSARVLLSAAYYEQVIILWAGDRGWNTIHTHILTQQLHGRRPGPFSVILSWPPTRPTRREW